MSLELNRRGFLIGLFGVAAVTAVGHIPQLEEPFDSTAWAKAVSEVYGRYIADLITFGTAAIRTDDKFPYIHNILPGEMTLDELKQAPTEILAGLFDDHSEARRAVSDAIGRKAVQRLRDEDKARRHTLGLPLED